MNVKYSRRIRAKQKKCLTSIGESMYSNCITRCRAMINKDSSDSLLAKIDDPHFTSQLLHKNRHSCIKRYLIPTTNKHQKGNSNLGHKCHPD